MRAGSEAIVSLADGWLRLAGPQGEETLPIEAPPEVLADYLSRGAGRRRPPVVQLRLPYSACLARRVEVPERARAQVHQILALDLERATPLSSSDVYSAHYRDGEPPEKKGGIAFRHLVVKKNVIDGAIAQLRSAGAEVAAVGCWSEDASEPLPVNFLDQALARSGNRFHNRRAARLLATLAVVLTSSAASVSYYRLEAALDGLKQETASARARLAGLNATREARDSKLREAAAIHRAKLARPPVVHILDELTRVLPDSAFLTEVTIDGDSIGITGHADQAAGLVAMLESSALFEAPTLDAPVTFDDHLDKERFTYRLRLHRTTVSGSPTGAQTTAAAIDKSEAVP